jgi:ectoine hydroxylase-related dioxygenase (phytanoyl-CoA dioxygenase family)
MRHPAVARLSALAAAYARDGAVVVRQLLSAGEVDLIRAGIDTNMARPSQLALRASDASDGLFFEDFCNWRRIPEFEHVARHSNVPVVAAALMRSRRARLHHDHVLVKVCRWF